MKLNFRYSLFALALSLVVPSLAQEMVDTAEEGFSQWQVAHESATLEAGHEGKPGIKFALEDNASVFRRPDVTDWSDVGAVSFWAFSERASRAVFGFALTSENSSEMGWSYFYLPITVDWEGWKHFVVKRNQFKNARTPTWNNITQIRFSLADWPAWCTAMPGESVIISDLKLLPAEEAAAQ